MKYLSLIKKYASGGLLIVCIVLFFLNKSANKDKVTLEAEKKEWRKDNISLTAELNAQKDFTNNLQKAHTQEKVYFTEEKGQIIKDYTTKLNKSTNLITTLKNKPPQYIIVKDSTNDTETLYDTFKEPNLTLKYSVKYKGKILGVNFDYTVKKEIKEVNRIIYEPYPVEKIKYLKTNYFLLGYSYVFKQNPIHDFSVTYLTKKGIGFKLGSLYLPNERKVYFKVGVEIAIPKK